MKVKAPFKIHIREHSRKVMVRTFGLVKFSDGSFRWRHWQHDLAAIGKASRPLSKLELAALKG